MPNGVRTPISTVVFRHVSDAVSLRRTRGHLVVAPHVKLLHLSRIDDRVAAHLDGAAVAGEFGMHMAREAVEAMGLGEIFLVAVRSSESRAPDYLRDLFPLAEVLPEALAGLTSVFGWVGATILKGIVSELLLHGDPFSQRIGVGARSLHWTDPGAVLGE